MPAKYRIPAILVFLLAGCASTNVASTDPVRARDVAEHGQARQNGTSPPSQADYVYPNWVHIANPAGAIMSDGHPELEATSAPAAQVIARTPAAAPGAALMTDAHPELATVKGGGSAQ